MGQCKAVDYGRQEFWLHNSGRCYQRHSSKNTTVWVCKFEDCSTIVTLTKTSADEPITAERAAIIKADMDATGCLFGPGLGIADLIGADELATLVRTQAFFCAYSLNT